MRPSTGAGSGATSPADLLPALAGAAGLARAAVLTGRSLALAALSLAAATIGPGRQRPSAALPWPAGQDALHAPGPWPCTMASRTASGWLTGRLALTRSASA